MREIKFRGKNNDGIWVYGYLMPTPKPQIHLGCRYSISVSPQSLSSVDRELFEVVTETIGQFTGLKDKNGKEIYEGDIVEVTALDFLDKVTNKKDFIIKYENGFICHIINEPNCWMHLKTAYEKASYSLRVIGNVFDNPKQERYESRRLD